MVGMGFIQGGSGFHFLSSTVYDYLAGMKVADMPATPIDEVADPEVRDFLHKVIISKYPFNSNSVSFRSYSGPLPFDSIKLWRGQGSRVPASCILTGG